MLKNLICPLFLLLLSFQLIAQQSPQTWVTFRVNVDNLRVRNAPDKNAKVVAELPEHTQLKYLNETAGSWDEVTLRNQKHKARWYKVETIDGATTGWVYGGAVALSSVYAEAGTKAPEWHYDFLDLHSVNETAYNAVASTFKNAMVYDTLQHQLNDSTILLKFDNGQQKKIVSTPPDYEENRQTFTYLGHIPAAHQYLVAGEYYEDADIRMYDIRNGNEIVSQNFPEIPQVSPDAKWLAGIWDNSPYEDESGIQIYKNISEGVFEFALITLQNIQCSDICWDKAGNIYFKYLKYPEDRNTAHYYCLKMPQL